MPRRARTYASSASRRRGGATGAALALALAGVLSACTGSGTPDDASDTTGGASASDSAPPPGKYDSLPEPCGAVGVGTLKEMFPGAADTTDGSGSTPDVTPSPFEGEAGVTYDTDRRVGCRWKSPGTLGTRHLKVDFERVVSYDTAVSDDELAEQLFARKAKKADIPLASTSPESSASAPS
ncbi:hypothetical protein G5C65_06430, partial [Streptomyces sp. SB3404]|nr:hypothetical protein [Streptomyces boncukensis]